MMPKAQGIIPFVLFFSLCEVVVASVDLQINVTGVDGKIKANVISYLSIVQQKDHPNLTEGRIVRLHQKAINEIKSALQPFGYYDPGIQSELDQQGQTWIAEYQISVGLPILISEMDIQLSGEGSEDDVLKDLILGFPSRLNNRLEHFLYEQGKDTILKTANDLGYLRTTLIKHEIRVDPENHKAKIVLHIETGPRHMFGEIIFDKTGLRPRLIKRYIPFNKGDPYSTAKLLELQNGLTDSDYFSEVNVRARRDLVDDLFVPVEVSLKLRHKHRYDLGLGYGTDTGPRASAGWQNRLINNRGHRLRIDVKGSKIKSNINAHYEIPIKNPRTDSVRLTAAWLLENPVTNKSSTLLTGLSRTVSKRRGWIETLYINYQSESFEIADEDRHAALFIPGITLSRTIADNRINTKHGSRLLLDLKAGYGSDTRFIQGRLNGKMIRSFGSSSRIILRGDIGSSDVAEFLELPTSLRFFAGGDQSVRGYIYNSIGPRNTAGDVIGGENLLVSSIELERKITGNWSGAIFYDVGNALDSFSDNLKQGAGVGIRWLSPIGPVRLDVAWALSNPGNPLRIHFVIGPDL